NRAARTSGRTRLLAGAAALLVAAVGSVSLTSPGLLAGADAALANSYVGANATNAVDVSRNYDRELAIQKPMQAQQTIKALAELKASVNKKNASRAAEIARNQWVIPVVGYRITARFGQGGGYWSSGRHTGLDFAGPSGSTLVSVAAGTVTSTGYEGAYGNRTIITLADGTEIWYCHQSSVQVSVGDQVAPGDVIGATGSTGNVTGPHLHLEVHAPGGGAVDPYAMLQAHGVNP
ncbi:M23 family metallopeptidase, partial [Aeromicrobium sp.]|uniref:M23 family metallopeptidase n=1 Tax=Aeromicrobium sp. TaxID=1871063 RepID=UPI0028ADD966